MARHRPTYTPLPTIPAAMRPRLTAILQVLAGNLTVSAAARSLGLSRNHFQTILHRGVQGLVEAITAKRGGRPRRSPTVTSLQQQLA